MKSKHMIILMHCENLPPTLPPPSICIVNTHCLLSLLLFVLMLYCTTMLPAALLVKIASPMPLPYM
jgi:hypothetical protein